MVPKYMTIKGDWEQHVHSIQLRLWTLNHWKRMAIWVARLMHRRHQRVQRRQRVSFVLSQCLKNVIRQTITSSTVKKRQKTNIKSMVYRDAGVNFTATNQNVTWSSNKLPAALTAHSGWAVKLLGTFSLIQREVLRDIKNAKHVQTLSVFSGAPQYLLY